MLTPVDIADATASAAADAEETDRVKRTELAHRHGEFFLSLLVGGCGLPESLCEASAGASSTASYSLTGS